MPRRRTLGRVSDELVYAHAGFGAEAVPYLAGWDLQRAVHQRRAAGEITDVCLMLEHQPVYTAGKRTRPADRPLGDPGAPVVEVDRGGKITWHGPGQLVGYPIIKLREPMDVIGYIRSLEEALIRTCADFGVTAQRVDGRSGAWITGGGPGGQAGRGPGAQARAPGRAGRRAPGRAGRRGPGRAGRRGGPQGRGDRGPGGARRDHARLRAELRLRPVLVRPHRAVRDQRRGRDHAVRGGQRGSRSPTRCR